MMMVVVVEGRWWKVVWCHILAIRITKTTDPLMTLGKSQELDR